MLLYLFGIGGFGRLVARWFSGVQRSFAVNSAGSGAQGPTGHGGRFAGAVTQLVEASLQSAVTTTVILWSIYQGEHDRLSSLSLEIKRWQKYITFIIQKGLTNESALFLKNIEYKTCTLSAFTCSHTGEFGCLFWLLACQPLGVIGRGKQLANFFACEKKFISETLENAK